MTTRETETMQTNVLILASLAVMTAGCASTVQKSAQSAPIPVGAEAGKTVVLNKTGSTGAKTAKEWEEFTGLWRDGRTQGITAVGAVFSVQDGEAIPTV